MDMLKGVLLGAAGTIAGLIVYNKLLTK